MTDAAFEAHDDSPSITTIDLDAAGATRRAGERHVRFVYEVARRAAIPTWLDAAAATRATLGALGEWLAADLRADMAEHLPDDLGQALADTAVSLRRGDVVALYRRAAAETGDDLSLHDVALRCAAVLAVLGESLPPHLVERLIEQLPDDIAALVALTEQRR